MRKGKYIKVWIYEENLPALGAMDNIGKTINNYIAANSQNTSNSYAITSALRSSNVSYTYQTNTNSSASLVCPNGHLILNGKKCISSACKYNKLVNNIPYISSDTSSNTQCLHKSCVGCKNGTCSGVHMISCPCPDCSVVL